MAYVPRYIYDVFVSYAHLDERTGDGRPGWVSKFAGELDVALGRELGEPAAIWFDRERLKAGFTLSEKIRYDLSRTAVLLRLESPSCWQSNYCKLERQWFQTPTEALDPLVLVSNRCRLLRAELLATPDVAPGDEILTPLHQHGTPLAPDAAAAGLAREIAATLREMESTREAVYVPRPSPQDFECAEVWTGVVGELKAQNFRFWPRVSADETEGQIRSAIDRARLAVLLIGADALAAEVQRRIEIATAASRPFIVWLSPLAIVAQEQTQLVAWIRQNAGPYELLERVSLERLKERIRQHLKRDGASALEDLRAAVAQRPRAGRAQIYLICDPRDRRKGAWDVKNTVERHGFDVLLPEIAAPDTRTLMLDHLRKLRSADGVLLYCQAATRKWFEQRWRELSDDTLPWRWRGAFLVQPPDKQRWIEEARALGYSDTPSDKVLVIDAEPEALTRFLPQLGAV